MSDVPPDLERRKQRELEYGQFVANKPIDIRGARAFNPGDPVPASHVERGVVSDEDVDKVKAPKAAAPTTRSEA